MSQGQEWKTVGLEILRVHHEDCGDGSCGCGCFPLQLDGPKVKGADGDPAPEATGEKKGAIGA